MVHSSFSLPWLGVGLGLVGGYSWKYRYCIEEVCRLLSGFAGWSNCNRAVVDDTRLGLICIGSCGGCVDIDMKVSAECLVVV